MIENILILLLIISNIIMIHCWRQNKIGSGLLISVLLALIGFLYIDRTNEETQALAYNKLFLQGILATILMLILSIFMARKYNMNILAVIPIGVYVLFMVLLSLFSKIKILMNKKEWEHD